jgi:hypothetical protein
VPKINSAEQHRWGIIHFARARESYRYSEHQDRYELYSAWLDQMLEVEREYYGVTQTEQLKYLKGYLWKTFSPD